MNTSPRRTTETAALLLDEPTASLDLKHQGDVLTVIKEQSQSGYAVLLVIHDLNLAAAFADDVVLMADGQIVGRGNPDDVLNEDLLSHTFGCRLQIEASSDGRRLVLPEAIARRLRTGAATL